MIKVNGLNYKYSGNNKYTLKGIDFEIKKGGILGFLGPSGAGKSTTQKILFGLLSKCAYEVRNRSIVRSAFTQA